MGEYIYIPKKKREVPIPPDTPATPLVDAGAAPVKSPSDDAEDDGDANQAGTDAASEAARTTEMGGELDLAAMPPAVMPPPSAVPQTCVSKQAGNTAVTEEDTRRESREAT